MDYHIFKSMLNNYYAKHIDGANRPTFFDIKATYPTLDQITQNFTKIKEEFVNVYKSQPNMPLYHEIDPGEAAISNTTDKKWKVFMLYLLGHKPAGHEALCPETYRLLDGIPNLLQAFFSILDPGKSIPEHNGPYLGYLRYHLGLHVPKDKPPTLFVNSQPYVWKEGEGVMFDDTWPHSVKNESTEYRAILIVDVLRPMPMMPTILNKLVTNLIARYTYGRRVINKLKRLHVTDTPLIT